MAKKIPGGTKYPTQSCVVDGATYEVDTNGQALAIRRVDFSKAKAASPAIASFVAKQAAESPVNEVTADVGAFLVDLGPVKRATRERCSHCGATGRHRYADPACTCACCACKECDGGYITRDPKPRGVWICDETYNANLVAAALKVAGASGSVRAWLGPGEAGYTPLILAGDAWRVVVMPFSRHLEGEGGDWPSLLRPPKPNARRRK